MSKSTMNARVGTAKGGATACGDPGPNSKDCQASPCQGTANFVLDLLSELLQERAQGGHLEIGEILSIVEGFKTAPGGLTGFYDKTYERCHEFDSPTARAREEFSKAISRLSESGRASLTFGRIQVIGLDDIKSRLGAQWPRLSEAVYRVGENVIRSQISGDDSFARNPNGGFVICFAHLDQVEAWFKAESIGHEIRVSLLGEADEEESLGAELTAELAANPAQVVATSHSIELPPSEHLDEAGLLELVDTRLDQAAASLKARSLHTLHQVEQSGMLNPRPVLTIHGSPSHLQRAELDARSKSSIDQLLAGIGEDCEILAELDLIMLAISADHLYHREADDQGLLVTDVHWSTLEDPTWADRYMKACSKLVGRAREGLVLNLRSATAATPPARIETLLARLAPYSRLRMLSIGTPIRGNLQPSELPAHLVAIDHRDIAALQRRGTDAAVFQGLRKEGSEVRLLIENFTPGASPERLGRLGASFVTFDTRPKGRQRS